MNVYLAGCYTRPYVIDEYMKVYLAGEHEVKNGSLAQEHNRSPYILESYFYAKENRWIVELIPQYKDFMLDSGAFTFMNKVDAGKAVNFETYVDEYADFILQYNVQKFFELDVDVVVGLSEVEKLRDRLEKRVGRQCIPVWHRSRGMDYWHRMVKQYKYIAIGGIVSREIKRNEYPVFNNLLRIAHDQGVKVHGLGFTNLKLLKKYPFDSVDSTAWLYGNRSGSVYKFNGVTVVKIDKPPGTMLHSQVVAINNFKEWVKFQHYAEQFL